MAKDRAQYWNDYYERNKFRQRERRRLAQKRYRQRHWFAIKIGWHWKVSTLQARRMIEVGRFE